MLSQQSRRWRGGHRSRLRLASDKRLPQQGFDEAPDKMIEEG